MLATNDAKAQAAPTKPKVFISYSRQDSAFADGLEAALAEAGFETLIDRQSIAPGEPWQERIGKLIAQADTVVFVVSPASVSSPICEWETDETERLSKRMLPLFYRDDMTPKNLTEAFVPAIFHVSLD